MGWYRYAHGSIVGKRMRTVVIATPLYPPEIGGPATYAKILEEELPKRGLSVELIKFSDVRHLPKLIRHIAYYRRVLRAARSADLVFALDPVSVGFPAALAARKAGKPFFVKIVGDYAWEQGMQRFGVTAPLDEFVRTRQPSVAVRALQRVERWVAERAKRILVPSVYLKEVVSAWGIRPASITVVYNAVDIAMIGKVPPDVGALPSPRIVSVGRLVPWKHMGRIIDAVQRMKGLPNASLTIVGGGPLRIALMRYARQKLGVRALVTGALSHADTLAIMKSADVFVLNSSYEGLSHVLIEALCLGKPIVATRAGGNPELIEDGVNGLLVPVADTAALAEALERLSTDAALRDRLANAARASAARFDRDRMVGDTMQVLTI